MFRSTLSFLFALLFPLSLFAWTEKAEFIYESAPFPQCHASTIVETTDGTLAAAWFGGTHEKAPDVGIWFSRRENGQWTIPVEVANGVQSETLRFPCWNPVLFQPKEGPLMLFFKVGPSPSQWWGEWMVSDDCGKTWRDRKRIPDGFIGPVKNKPVQLADGTILCPSSTEHDGWTSHFEWTRDGGKTWEKTAPIHSKTECGTIQPTILFHKDGKLQMLARSNSGFIFTAFSQDQGKTWTKPEPLDLPNPNSGIDAVTLEDGRFLLVYNPVSGNWGKRNWLVAAVSTDGQNWKTVCTLAHENAGEFSYPAVIQTSDGRVHVTFTWLRRKVRHVTLEEL